MKNHLQPITMRANAGIKKDCGCGSPNKKALVGNQKNLPENIKAKILAAPGKMKSKEDKPSNKEPKFMENIEMNSESPSKMCGKKH